MTAPQANYSMPHEAPARFASMLDAALWYADHGFAVIPLHGKLPAIPKGEGGNGYLDATTDQTIIQGWWQRWPTANIAVCTRASGLCVLDVDPRNEGDATLPRLEAEHGTLPNTPEAITGSGGRHIYLRAPDPDNVARKSRIFGETFPGLDLPNYVVAPPSLHPETGRRYRWDALLHIAEIPLAPAPAWLALLAGQDTPRRTAAPSTPPGWLGLVFEALLSYLEEHDCQPRQVGDGIKARCPLHDDRNPSFSLHPTRGWKCFVGCGEGRLTLLAAKLGIRLGVSHD